jgi:hypothetical protein
VSGNLMDSTRGKVARRFVPILWKHNLAIVFGLIGLVATKPISHTLSDWDQNLNLAFEQFGLPNFPDRSASVIFEFLFSSHGVVSAVVSWILYFGFILGWLIWDSRRKREGTKMKVGRESVVMGTVPQNIEVGDGSVVIGATDNCGSTNLTTPMAVGKGAFAGPRSIAIGAYAGAGMRPTQTKK